MRASGFKNGDYLFVPDIRKAVEEKAADIKAYVVGEDLKEIHLHLGDMTDAEREIILKGCLINTTETNLFHRDRIKKIIGDAVE